MTFHETLERAESLARETDEATREALVSCLRRLGRFYDYLASEGQPEPNPIDAPPPADSLEALAARWREAAAVYREGGAEAQARLCERHAEEVEATEAARAFDTVTLEEASEIGGYSYSQLQHLVATGEIPNAGRKGAPRIYRRDVPRKPGYGSPAPARPKLEIIEDAVRREREATNG